MRRGHPDQQAGLFLKAVHDLFLAQPITAWLFKGKLVTYPLAYDYGLFTSISTYPNLLTFPTP